MARIEDHTKKGVTCHLKLPGADVCSHLIKSFETFDRRKNSRVKVDEKTQNADPTLERNGTSLKGTASCLLLQSIH